MQDVADPGRGGRELLEYRPWRVSCAPGRHLFPGVARWGLHSSRVRAWRGAKGGTVCRRRWHAGGPRLSCGAAALIHLHAMSGTSAPNFMVPMFSACSSARPCTRRK